MTTMSPYVRVSLILVGCVMVYGFALWNLDLGQYDNQFDPIASKTTSSSFSSSSRSSSGSSTQQPEYPSGYSTGIIEFLHDLPRSTFTFEEVDNTFYPGQKDYWFGAGYLAAWVLAVGIIVTFLCGIPCCIIGGTAGCGKLFFEEKKSAQILLKIMMVLTLVATIGVLVTANVANSKANNEFIPIIEVPDKMLNGLNNKLLTVEKEARSQGIDVPMEIVRAQRTIQGVQNNFQNVIPDAITNIVDELYDVRGYAFMIVFNVGIAFCLAGIIGIFFLRGNTFTFWLAFMFLSFLSLALIVAPLLMVNTIVADVCIDSNTIIIRPIPDNTTAQLTIFYLFCPDDYTPDLDFVDKLMNDTQTVLVELEEGRDEALDETDTELVSQYDQRIQQTEDLLIKEESLYYCNATSEEYNDFIEEICKDSLKWNWVLMWLIFSALIFEVFALCFGCSAVFILPKKSGQYIEIPYEVV